ncbi:MAG TPA: hypothetical protein VMD74_01395 [Candidatus Methylomirabilis sp.]|nr:hypothetical protein [Candidatus Methylomirabilis sp.]
MKSFFLFLDRQSDLLEIWQMFFKQFSAMHPELKQYEAVFLDSAEAGREFVSQNAAKIKIALIDHELRLGFGYEIAEILRSLNPETIIYYSSVDSIDCLPMDKRMIFFKFCEKPINPKNFFAEVLREIGSRQLIT